MAQLGQSENAEDVFQQSAATWIHLLRQNGGFMNQKNHLDTVTTSRWWVYEQEMLISSPKIRTEQDFLMGFKTIRWERERIRGMVIHIVKESKEPLSLSRFQMPYSALQF